MVGLRRLHPRPSRGEHPFVNHSCPVNCLRLTVRCEVACDRLAHELALVEVVTSTELVEVLEQVPIDVERRSLHPVIPRLTCSRPTPACWPTARRSVVGRELCVLGSLRNRSAVCWSALRRTRAVVPGRAAPSACSVGRSRWHLHQVDVLANLTHECAVAQRRGQLAEASGDGLRQRYDRRRDRDALLDA